MSDADRIAINVKHTIQQLQRIGCTVNSICLGYKEKNIIESNLQPCLNPDYELSAKTLCGIPIIWCDYDSFFSVGIAYGLWPHEKKFD